MRIMDKPKNTVHTVTHTGTGVVSDHMCFSIVETCIT